MSRKESILPPLFFALLLGFMTVLAAFSASAYFQQRERVLACYGVYSSLDPADAVSSRPLADGGTLYIYEQAFAVRRPDGSVWHYVRDYDCYVRFADGKTAAVAPGTRDFSGRPVYPVVYQFDPAAKGPGGAPVYQVVRGEGSV